MACDSDFNIPILQIANEQDAERMHILVEPHLEIYELPPGKLCDVLYNARTDTTDPHKTLTIAQREDCLVIYAPGPFAPEIRVDGKLLKNLWAGDE